MRFEKMVLVRLTLAAVVITLVLGGCRSGAQRAERNPKALLLDTPAGRLGVDVQNDNGSVSVIVDPTATRASILARPASGGKANPELVVADVVDDSTGTVLRVVGAHDSAVSGPVDITIRVPACAGIRVRSSGGPIVVNGVTGAIDIVSGGAGSAGGSVVVSTRAPLTAPISIRSGGGHVILEAGIGTAGTVEASAPLGNVRTEIAGAATEHMRQTPSGWAARLGGSDNPIRLTADRGSITFRVGQSAPLPEH